MSVVIGLAIGTRGVRAVAAVRGRITWAMEIERHADDALPDLIVELVRRAPHSLAERRRRVVAVIGPSDVQVKRLAEFPSISDPAVLARVVRENVGRFFVCNGTPPITSGVEILSPGVGRAAAYREPTATQVQMGCRAAGLRIVAIAPAVVAIARVVENGSVVWQDGTMAAEILSTAGRLDSVRHLVSETVGIGKHAPTVVGTPLFDALGQDGWRFADAIGATRIMPNEPLVMPLPGRTHVRSVRLSLAMFAATSAISLSVMAPGISARAAARRAATQLSALDARVRQAAAVEHELALVTRALQEMKALEAARHSCLQLLAVLARELPPNTAVVALRADSTDVSLVVLAPQVAQVIGSLGRVPELGTAELVGPITHDVVEGQELERGTVHLRLAGASR